MDIAQLQGRRAQAHRTPALLALVFAAFLVIIGVTASAQTMLVSTQLTSGTLNSVVGDDTSLVRVLVNGTLTPADLSPADLTAERVATLGAKLSVVVARDAMIRAEVRTLGGTLLFSSDGRTLPILGQADFARAAQGFSAASILPAPDEALGTSQVLAEFLPIMTDGTVRAVFVVERDAVPIIRSIDATRQQIVVVTLSAALIVGAVLYLIFRSAQRRLARQTKALVEATRRDALTETLNHGAMVTELSSRIEAARQSSGRVDIALIDIDGFRLLNDTHGHNVGDLALTRVCGRLIAAVPDGSIVGRYGPDEFLVIAPAIGTVPLEAAMARLRAELSGVSLEVEGADPLPLTVSVGLCGYPFDAASVTELLSVGAMTVAEAKASGGDAIRLANALGSKPGFAKTFDVLQGLVIAVDTKDRYTKRHSEDVARYADFLAGRLGLEPDLRRAVHIAGLLHDVGKIGIPDAVLRKPGRLTADEFAVIQQHVALGDMIVRDLPNIELVRAGVRYHHERWDGQGYVEALAGEDIPLIGRIMAVADAFSAMTTTRPYRKALSVEEALRRLEDAAGTQLQESLVRAFVDGIGSAANPPMPDTDAWRTSIWTPAGQVA